VTNVLPEWLAAGGFACALDYDSYWKLAAMHEMDKFYTDDVEQLMYYRSVGYFQDIPKAYGELADIILDKKPGRENEKERNMAMNLGLATAKMIYDRAEKKRVGTWLNLCRPVVCRSWSDSPTHVMNEI
jgi:ornithine cyclodeaminase/alanine dehydrogenase-like protein (mu-crystallin family)